MVWVCVYACVGGEREILTMCGVCAKTEEKKTRK